MPNLHQMPSCAAERRALERVTQLPPHDLLRFADEAMIALLRVERDRAASDHSRYTVSGVLDRFEVDR